MATDAFGTIVVHGPNRPGMVMHALSILGTKCEIDQLWVRRLGPIGVVMIRFCADHEQFELIRQMRVPREISNDNAHCQVTTIHGSALPQDQVGKQVTEGVFRLGQPGGQQSVDEFAYVVNILAAHGNLSIAQYEQAFISNNNPQNNKTVGKSSEKLIRLFNGFMSSIMQTGDQTGFGTNLERSIKSYLAILTHSTDERPSKNLPIQERLIFHRGVATLMKTRQFILKKCLPSMNATYHPEKYVYIT